MAGAWSRIGVVRSVNPAKRELRIDPARASANRAEQLKRVRVAVCGGETMVCTVDAAKSNGDGWIVTLGSGVSRDAVANMKGATVDTERRRTESVAPAELDAADWIGLNVVGADRARIGVITGCIESPAHDILEIETPDGRQVLLPAIEQTVESIDLETRTVTVGDIAPHVISDAH
ncbi:MAG: hypothetical protein HUU46_21475 [Candidatus Hydrogenedentes bacterium]|nr:hypothetical protein [Candidatus Hydrogenedentota bacterium]